MVVTIDLPCEPIFDRDSDGRINDTQVLDATASVHPETIGTTGRAGTP
jgi:hypothetical protein